MRAAAAVPTEWTFVGRGHWPDQQPRRLRALVSIPTIDKLGTTHAARPSIRISPSNSQHARTAISLNVRSQRGALRHAASCRCVIFAAQRAVCRLQDARRRAVPPRVAARGRAPPQYIRLHFAAVCTACCTTGCTTGWTERFEYSYNK